MPATYEPIATTTLGSAASSITFSSIPGTYTDLRLVWIGTNTSTGTITLRVNSDSGSNYSTTWLYGSGSTAVSYQDTSVTNVRLDDSTSGTTSISMYEIDFLSYAGSTNKSWLNNLSADRNGSGGITRGVSLWRNTNAITSITMTSGTTFSTGTTATLYGILKA